jgi:hypothetical protein
MMSMQTRNWLGNLARCCVGIAVLANVGCGDSSSPNEPALTTTDPSNTSAPVGDEPSGPVASGPDDTSSGPGVTEPGPATEWSCFTEDGEKPDVLSQIGCERDFRALAAEPSDSSLPGAWSVKVIIDRVDDNSLYFQNSVTYPLHYNYASQHLSAVGDLPVIADQAAFNDNYYSAQRRFYLGAVTYYSGPQAWVFELAPYDTATVEMITEAFNLVSSAGFFGDKLKYHPTGSLSEEVAKGLPASVPVMTTGELYAGIDYQPLTLGRSCGKLVFYTAEELETNYVSFQEIVVLDAVPNDISVAQGIITAEFQTPLSHVNVLSQNRGTPNMALRGAFDSPELRALEGKWVTLEVGPHEPSIKESDPEDKDSCMVVPTPVEIKPMDLSVTELTDIEKIYDPDSDVALRTQISNAVPAFGGKASHYSALSRIPEANAPKAFAIPVYFYNQFMVENGFDERVKALLADEEFNSDPGVRDAALEALRDDMKAAPVNEEFLVALKEKLNTEYPGQRMRFRSSTNAEDLGDFTGAGLYTSKSGDPNDPESPVEDAIRKVWASLWFFRAYEERTYQGIDHTQVGMALLVHRSFPQEDATGVATTANPFDSTGVEPGFYVNVQSGDNSVVLPERGHTTEQFIYYYELDGAITYLGRSNLVPEGEYVLSPKQVNELGRALKAIHQFFQPAYGNNANGWYAMDVEFKFDAEEGQEAQLYVKQARPLPKR